MPESALATPPPAGVIESAPKTSTDAFPGLSASADDLISKSGLGTPEFEQRVSKGSRKSTPKQPEKKEDKAEKPKEDQKTDLKTEAKPEEKSEAKPEEQKKEVETEPTKETPTTDEKKQGPWQRVQDRKSVV